MGRSLVLPLLLIALGVGGFVLVRAAQPSGAPSFDEVDPVFQAWSPI